MSGDLITEITIFVLAVFVGFEVISKVPTMLHTPLMSGTNAIHGIVLLGGLIVVGAEGADTLTKIAGTVAVVFGTINIVGGFLVTDRMLEMFKGRKKPGEKKWLIVGSFLRDLDFINSPIWSRRCCSSSASVASATRARPARATISPSVGMVIAVVATLLHPDVEELRPDRRRRSRSARVIGGVSARVVKMTRCRRWWRIFNGVGGGAVALVAPRSTTSSSPRPARSRSRR